MSRRRALWIAACVAAPWALAAVWTFLDRHAHLVDRAIRTLEAWTNRTMRAADAEVPSSDTHAQRTEPA